MSLVKRSCNLNAECTILPPGSCADEITDEVTATAILPSNLILARINLVKNVFPVSPETSRNIRSPCRFSTQSTAA